MLLKAKIVNRILNILHTTIDQNKIINRIEYITSDQIIAKLRWAIDELGYDRLDYLPEEIEYHSIRSGATIIIYLSPK